MHECPPSSKEMLLNTEAEEEQPPVDEETNKADDQPKADNRSQQCSENEKARQQRDRRTLSSCTSIEPWLLEQFPLDTKEVVLTHVQHKTSMLPHFQIRLTSNASHDGKQLV